VSRKIVVVEDDPDIRDLIEAGLSKETFRLLFAEDGIEGLRLIREEVPHLVVLDIMLPGLNGLDVCRRLKSDRITEQIPIIFLTAKAEETDILLGLNMGADDYVVKPFSPKELAARIASVSKRGPVLDASTPSLLKFEELTIDRLGFEVFVGSKLIALTATEFRLLEYLARNPNRVFSRDQLLNSSISENAIVIDRNIDVHIRGIRKKLGNTARFIQTVRGVGYRFSHRE
jgi:two-component system alkaline phosphatase synthesis response regulator PhoP